jgi:hypothetical protein
MRYKQAFGCMCAPVVAALLSTTALAVEAQLPKGYVYSDVLVPGEYGCSSDLFTLSSRFEIVGSSQYIYLGGERPIHDIRYDPETYAVHFLNGPFWSEDEQVSITGYTVLREDDKRPMIWLLFVDPAYGVASETCRLRIAE